MKLSDCIRCDVVKRSGFVLWAVVDDLFVLSALAEWMDDPLLRNACMPVGSSELCLVFSFTLYPVHLGYTWFWVAVCGEEILSNWRFGGFSPVISYVVVEYGVLFHLLEQVPSAYHPAIKATVDRSSCLVIDRWNQSKQRPCRWQRDNGRFGIMNLNMTSSNWSSHAKREHITGSHFKRQAISRHTTPHIPSIHPANHSIPSLSCWRTTQRWSWWYNCPSPCLHNWTLTT